MKNDRLLVIHQGALGDLVVTFPALLHLRKRFRRIDGLCQRGPGELGCHLNIFDAAFPLESAAASSLYAPQPDHRIRRFINQSGAILLFSSSDTLEKALKQHVQIPVYRIPPRPKPELPVHVGLHIFSRLQSIGLIKEGRDAAEVLMGRRAKPLSASRRVLIQPGSGSPRKNWPLDRYLAVEQQLLEKGWQVEWVLGPAEDAMKEKLGEGRILHQPERLPELADLLSGADGYIGNDAGVTHLAAFTGLPTLAIFGPSSPERWRPVGHAVQVVQSAVPDCEACFETDRNNCGQPSCLTDISAERVVAAFQEMFS